MAEDLSNIQSGSAVAVAAGAVGSVNCPLCQTAMTSAADAASPAGGWWRCTGCGQAWTTGRLRVVAAYALYASARR